MMGSFVEENEERVLDELLGQFSVAGGKPAALQELQKAKKATEKVNAAINQALQKRGEPFTFPPELSKEELALVTQLTLGGTLTLDAFRKIIERMPHISDLNLRNTYADAETLALLGKLNELRHIRFSDTSPATASVLHTIVTRCPYLITLQIEAQSVTDEMMDLVCQLKELRTLSLSGCSGMTDANVQKLAALKELRTLKLANNSKITMVEALSACRKLESLDLSYCTGIVSLKGLDACTKLESLKLFNCRSIKDLAPLAACTKLRNLDCFRLEHVTSVAPLATCVELAELDLRGCSALTSLKPLLACTQLRGLFRPSIGKMSENLESDCTALQQAIPQLKVF